MKKVNRGTVGSKKGDEHSEWVLVEDQDTKLLETRVWLTVSQLIFCACCCKGAMQAC